MTINDLTYHYTNLMAEAEQATSRKEALSCIRKATLLQEAITVLKGEKWCGGAGGWDNFVERWH